MKVAVAGGHGKIARLLEGLLVKRGDSATGLVRNPDHADDLRELGAEPLLCDLEGDGDVAAVLLACLDIENTIGREFDLLSGETPIEEALAAL